MQRDQALETIRNHRAELLDFGISSLSVFGSVARDTACVAQMRFTRQLPFNYEYSPMT
jgi:hypothetical protein